MEKEEQYSTLEDLRNSFEGSPEGENPQNPEAGADPAENPELVPEGISEDEEEVTPEQLLGMYGLPEKFEYDGREVAYSELSAEEREEVLLQIMAKNADAFAEGPEDLGLEKSEVEIINALRESGMTLDQLIESRARELAGSQQEYSEDISSWDSRQVFAYDFMNQLPEEELDAMSESDLRDLVDSEYEKVKDSPLFEKRMETRKKALAEEQKREMQMEEARLAEEREEAIENERKQFVIETRSIDSIGQFKVDDGIKAFIYEKLLETNEEGVPKFVEEMILSSPEKAFRTAFYAYYGEQNEKTIAEHYGKQLKIAREEGKREALKDFPEKPVSRFSSAPEPRQNASPQAKKKEGDYLSLDDIREGL